MRPSKILSIYYISGFALGCLLSLILSGLVSKDELGLRGAAIMTLCWNVLLVMLLPLVLDWGESRYFKARFMQLEEIVDKNPELASVLSEQCRKLSLQKLRLAVVDTPESELFSYGLWGSNPRLVLSGSFLDMRERAQMLPSIEAELSRFTSQDQNLVFLLFATVQIILQYLIILLA